MLLLVLVLCVVGAGDGDGSALPIVGMSPAKTGTDRTQVRVNAIPSRFIDCLLLLELSEIWRDARNLASANKQQKNFPCKVVVYRTTIPLVVTFPPAHSKGSKSP